VLYKRIGIALGVCLLIALGISGAARAQVTGTGTNVTNTNNNLNDNDNNQEQSQRQSQTQNVNIRNVNILDARRRLSGGGSKLPKTGVDAAEAGALGTVSLLSGLSLMEFARRRRSHWVEPVSAIEAVAVPKRPADVPAGAEADLLLPYERPHVPPARPPDDLLPPGF
jgi:hypothetical protein